jgi:enamine deaminase RidA (YjgF/YER057c/UK114 family)
MSITRRISELGLVLPKTKAPAANYANAVTLGNLVYCSGSVPVTPEGEIPKGKVGRDFSADEAAEHARLTGLHLLSIVRDETGDLDRVKRVIKILGMVNATADFLEHSKVINGCSDLFESIFGEKHARSAVGMGSLPFGISVEIEAIFELG